MTTAASVASIGPSLRPVLALLLILAAVTLGACSPGGSAADASPVATTAVDLPRSYRFAPEAIVVSAGSTVTWTNHDNFSHNVHFDGADPLPMAPGESAERTFDAPGVYPHVCSLHPKDMTGSVLVAED